MTVIGTCRCAALSMWRECVCAIRMHLYQSMLEMLGCILLPPSVISAGIEVMCMGYVYTFLVSFCTYLLCFCMGFGRVSSSIFAGEWQAAWNL
jgi:hypothetical protein